MLHAFLFNIWLLFNFKLTTIAGNLHWLKSSTGENIYPNMWEWDFQKKGKETESQLSAALFSDMHKFLLSAVQIIKNAVTSQWFQKKIKLG